MKFSVYGKTLINEYNSINKQNETPESFFKNIFLPLMLDNKNKEHKNSLYIKNNFFFHTLNGDNMKEKRELFENSEISELFNIFKEKLNKNVYDGSIYLNGAPLQDKNKTNAFAGQALGRGLDEIEEITSDEIYLSYIGYSLGLHIEGDFQWYFNDGKLLYSIFKGWSDYRRLLNTSDIQTNGIFKWNTINILFKNEDEYVENYSLQDLKNIDYIKVKKENDIKTTKENLLNTFSSVKLYFSLSKYLKKDSVFFVTRLSIKDPWSIFGYYTMIYNNFNNYLNMLTTMGEKDFNITNMKNFDLIFDSFSYIKKDIIDLKTLTIKDDISKLNKTHIKLFYKMSEEELTNNAINLSEIIKNMQSGYNKQQLRNFNYNIKKLTDAKNIKNFIKAVTDLDADDKTELVEFTKNNIVNKKIDITKLLIITELYLY